ncbi:OprD family outer membrane porin [Acinetobacter sp. MB5]|uniref:OprD family outer membrane porin n=1 Tax=Acinetobacter sp. MB5 TaxID=2069438 RepID=UPI000DD0D8C7|nr:OprD family outer membrane porin [Acinetobacter sp. MB5]
MEIRSSTLLRVLWFSATSSLPILTHADFVEDSNVKLDLKNFYLDRNYSGTTHDVGSWSQGLDLQYSSGYTDTMIQVGLDASAQGAITLHSQGNDGSLPYDPSTGKAKDDYGRFGATLKLKYSKTKLTIGDHRPNLPIASEDPSRQLDTIFEGAVLQSNEIKGLNLTAGTFWKAVTRQSSGKEDLYLYGGNGVKRSSGLTFVGGTYDLSHALSATYFYAELKDIYTQQYLGLKHKAELPDGLKLTSDIRYFDNGQNGQNLYGKVHGQSFGSMVTLHKNAHTLSLSYQNMHSSQNFPTMNGSIPQPYLVHWSALGFVRPDEKSYGIKYSYNFKDFGLPGLNFSTRYIYGNDINYGSDKNATESERNISFNYTIQKGKFAGLKFDLRNIHVNKSFADGYNEFRFITTYTYKF